MKTQKITKRDIISLFLVLGVFLVIGISILKINMSAMKPNPPVVKTADEYVDELTVYYINKYHKCETFRSIYERYIKCASI